MSIGREIGWNQWANELQRQSTEQVALLLFTFKTVAGTTFFNMHESVKGILPQKVFYRPNLIFWIVMGCCKTPKIENFGLKICSLGTRGNPHMRPWGNLRWDLEATCTDFEAGRNDRKGAIPHPRKQRRIYDSIATVGESRVWWRADFQSGSRV